MRTAPVKRPIAAARVPASVLSATAAVERRRPASAATLVASV